MPLFAAVCWCGWIHPVYFRDAKPLIVTADNIPCALCLSNLSNPAS